MPNNTKSPPVTDLTLRDLFAALAAGAIWRDMPVDLDSGECAHAVAQKSYLVADAMLHERGFATRNWEQR